MDMLNLQTRQAEPVPDEQVQAAYLNGTHTFIRGTTIPVKNSGGVWQVPSAEAGTALENGTIATPEDVSHAQLQAKYEGTPLTAMAAPAVGGAASLVRGATLGMADKAAISGGRLLGGESGAQSVRGFLQGEQQLHPVESTSKEIAGAIVPMFLGDEVGAASTAEKARGLVGAGEEAGALTKLARAATAPAKMLSRSGEMAAGLTERALARVGPRTAKLAGKITGGAIENGLFGVANQIDEDTLGNHRTNGEKLLGTFGHDMLLGGGLSAGFGLAGEGASLLMRGASKQLKSAAEEQAWRWAGGTKPMSKEAERFVEGGSKGVGRELLDEGLPMAKPMEPVEKLEVIKQRLDQAGERIADISKNTRATMNINEVADRLSAVVKPFRSHAIYEPVVESGNKIIGGMFADLRGHIEAGTDEIPIVDFMKIRRAWQDVAFNESRKLDPANRVELLRNFTRELGGMEKDALDKTARQLGGPSGADLKAANKRYQALMFAKRGMEENAAKELGNRMHGLTTTIGTAAAVASGHGLLGVLGGVAHEYALHHGNGIAAVALDRMAQYGQIQRAVAKTDGVIDRGLSDFLKDKKLPVHPYRHTDSGDLRERYEKRAERARAAASVPELQARDFQKHMIHAPKTAASVSETANRATRFLVQSLPKGHVDKTSLTPQLERPKITDAEMHAWLKVSEVADGGPDALMHYLNSHRLTNEQVEAFKEIHPKTYDEIRTKLLKGLQSLKEKPSAAQMAQLKTLLGVPANRSLSPEFIATMQQTFQGQDQGQPKPGATGNAPKRPLSNMAQPASLPMK